MKPYETLRRKKALDVTDCTICSTVKHNLRQSVFKKAC
jgi:hypothetical protein